MTALDKFFFPQQPQQGTAKPAPRVLDASELAQVSGGLPRGGYAQPVESAAEPTPASVASDSRLPRGGY